MATAQQTIDIDAAPDAVWGVIGDPAALSDWHPAIVASGVTDRVRQCTIDGAGETVEPIEEHSDTGRFYVYTLTEGPFPMTGYRSRLAVEDVDGASRVVWSADFTPDDPTTEATMVAQISGLYRMGLEAVRERLDA